jgi:hypothetical protein
MDEPDAPEAEELDFEAVRRRLGVHAGVLTRWLALGRLDARRLPDDRLVPRHADLERLSRRTAPRCGAASARITRTIPGQASPLRHGRAAPASVCRLLRGDDRLLHEWAEEVAVRIAPQHLGHRLGVAKTLQQGG